MTAINGIEEKILIERLLESDQIAFELLFRFYYSGLVVFARQIVIDKEETDEIVQDFFVSLWKNRKKIKKNESLKNYFFVSIRNRAYNTLKRNRIKENSLLEIKRLIEQNSIYNPDLYIASELQEKIAEAIKNLPNRTGEIFRLSRIQGLTNDEIANELKLSKRTVETQISSAIKILRKELKEYLFVLIVLGISAF